MKATVVMAGDMVICPSFRVGLLVNLSVETGKAGVIFANKGPVHQYELRSLRQASMARVEAAGLYGVGCNPFRT